MNDPAAPASTPSWHQWSWHQWLPGAGALVSGLSAAIVVLVGESALGLAGFAPIASLWTIWAICAASLTFSAQQIAVLFDGHPNARREVWRQTRLALSTALVLLASLSLLFGDNLFGTRDVRWSLFALALPIGALAVGLLRGLLASRGDIVGLATVIGGENVIRLALFVVFMLASASALWFGFAVVAGFGIVGATAARFRRSPPPAVTAAQPTGHRFGASAATGFASHTLLNGAPVLVALRGAEAVDISTLFLLLTVVRVPLLIVQAIVPTLSVRLRDNPDLALTPSMAAAVGVVAAVAATGGALVGGPLFELLFDTAVPRSAVAFAAAAGVLSMANILISVLHLDRCLASQTIGIWLAGLVAVGLSLTLLPIGLTAVAATLACGEVAVMVALVATLSRAGTANVHSTASG